MKLDDLTPDRHQRTIIDDFSAERTIVVTGVAGSGKSLTLLKKAKQVSAKSDSYAIIVYTKSLKQFFRDELAEIDPKGEHVYYLNEWKRSDKPHYEYLFIDECQDFNADEIADFAAHGTYLWLFGDDNQAIMAFKPSANGSGGREVQLIKDTIAQLNAEHQDLCINHRLTAENAALASFIRPGSDLCDACYRHGDKPVIIRADNEEAELDSIIDTIRNASLTNVGILTHYNSRVSEIRKHFAGKGIPVEWKDDSNDNIDFKSTNPKIMTIHSAKGLEFSTIFVPFCHKPSYDDERSTLYVATTRPLNQLVLTYSSRLSSFLPKPGSSVYSNPQ